jgi:protocatechuate 3,4-dioxygenase beta subunit
MIRGALLLILTSIAADAQSGGALAGKVINSANNAAIPGATISLRGTDSGTPQTYLAQTGADGRFSIMNIVPGTYELRTAKSGFEQTAAGRPATARDFPPIQVEAGKPIGPVEVRLIPDGVITGRITDPDGDPVRHASVAVQQYGYAGGKKTLRNVRNAGTDDRGQYRLYHLPPGKYWLHVESNQNRNWLGQIPPEQRRSDLPLTGLGAAYYPGSPDVAHATELQLAPGAELTGIDVRLTVQRLYSIRGRYPHADQRGVTFYAQNLSPTENRGVNAQTRIENDQYEIAGLLPGRYLVIGQEFPTGPERNGAVKSQDHLYGNEVVEIVDRDIEHVDLTFEPQLSIHGAIRAEGTANVKDALNVSLAAVDLSNGFFGSNNRVEADGTFKLESPPGIYRLHVNGRQIYLKKLLMGDQALPDSKIDIKRITGDLTVVVANDFGKIEGSVKDDAGKPVYNADVTLIPDQKRDDWQEHFRIIRTKPDGTFSMQSIEPGEYRLYAWSGVEQGAWQDAEFRKPFEERGTTVKVEPNGALQVDLKVIQGAN